MQLFIFFIIEKSERVIPQLKHHLSNLYFICTHSSSKYPGIFRAEQLLKSNSQLNEVAPSVIKETKEYLFHDLMKESKSTNTILNTLNQQQQQQLILNRISKDRSPSFPIPPPPVISKNENSFVNNNFSNKISNTNLSFISDSYNSNINKKQENVSLNSCQVNQKDRRGYIIPNFYSFPKKNTYNWEQYKANLRKDFLRISNNSIPSNRNSNYNGHSLKETLSSSVILVGKQGFFTHNI